MAGVALVSGPFIALAISRTRRPHPSPARDRISLAPLLAGLFVMVVAGVLVALGLAKASFGESLAVSMFAWGAAFCAVGAFMAAGRRGR